MEFIVLILSMVLIWQWVLSDDEPKCKCNCQCNQKPVEEPLRQEKRPEIQYREERCTCGTEYDFDGIPRRKSCKKHGY